MSQQKTSKIMNHHLTFFCNMVWPWRFVPTFLSFEITKDQFENPSTSLDEFDQGSEAASWLLNLA